MNLRSLADSLPTKTGAVYTLEAGERIRHSYAALHDQVIRARDALLSWGVAAESRVGVYAPNSHYWLIYDLALIEIGAIMVPFTEDFAGAVNEELLARYHIALLLISKNNAQLFPDSPAYVAFLDGDNGNVQALDRSPPKEGDETDQHSLVFSSGSAGGLKGLVISRKGVETTLPPIIEALGIKPRDRLLLFLPMSNFQQRNMCYAAIWYDFDIIITDYTQLFAAMKLLHPTILIGPPVLYQMMYAEFAQYPEWKKSLWLALGSILSQLPGVTVQRALARRLFGEFYRQFGNNIRVLVTGMAPIRQNIGQFFAAMQLPLCETYGMVEAGSLTYRHAYSREYGSVGKPVRGVNLVFADDGEIFVERENPLTLRYFQCADGENERTFLSTDRIATGDIGTLDSEGNLFLLGRKKELIVTAGGYKIHPEVIEEELNNCASVAHSVVFLKRGTSQLACIVSLNQPEREGAHAVVKKFAQGLKSAKKAAQFVDVVFAEEPFSRDNGLLRPNLKIDRKAIAARYNI